MATQAAGGFGAKFLRDNGAGVFEEIAEIGDVDGPQISQEIVDATHMASPDGYTEKIAVGLREGGDITFPMNLLPGDASQNALYNDLNSTVRRNYRVVYPSGTRRVSITGFVRDISQSLPMRDKMVNNVVIAVTGKPVWEAHP